MDDYAGPFTVFSDDQEGDIYVYRQCPECGRFIKSGRLFVCGLGVVMLKDWICKKHGEVKPLFVRL